MKDYFITYFSYNKYSSKYLFSYILKKTFSDYLCIYIKTKNKTKLHFTSPDNNKKELLKIEKNIDEPVIIKDFEKNDIVTNIEKDIENCVVIPFNFDETKYFITLLNMNCENKEKSIKQIQELGFFFNFFLHSEYKTLNTEQIFLAEMSHEIRTPLNGIIGYNQLLSKTTLDKTQKNYLKSMNECNIQLMTIINDVFDFTNLKNGNMKIVEECYFLGDIQKIINDTVCTLLNNKKQKLVFNFSEQLPRHVINDKSKFIQILINIISNSIKYSKENDTIEIKIDLENDKMLRIQITDNGPGIEEKHLECLFDCMYKSDNNKKSLGLGLYITKNLVDVIKGEIDVQTKLGYGTTFTCKIPFEKYELENINSEYMSGIFKGRNVLLVDDNINNRIVISEYLHELQINPYICASALEAMRMILCKRYHFDLALIDICMPTISGIELAFQIKEEVPSLPLFALSSDDNLIKTSDFMYILPKPIDKVILIDRMCKVFKNSKLNNPLTITNTFNIYDTKILIVEDDKHNSNILKNMLNVINFVNVEICDDGVIALQNIKSDKVKYDIIILDLKMPIMDGITFMKNIHKLKNVINIPNIIITSAHISEEDRRICESLNVQNFITKPIMLCRLKKCIYNIFDLNSK